MILIALYRCTMVRCLFELLNAALACPAFTSCYLAGQALLFAFAEQQPIGQHQNAALQHRVVAAPAANAVAAPQPAARRRRQRQGLLHKLFRIPAALINAGAQIIVSIFNLGVTLTTGIGSRVLPQSIQRNLQGMKLIHQCILLC